MISFWPSQDVPRRIELITFHATINKTRKGAIYGRYSCLFKVVVFFFFLLLFFRFFPFHSLRSLVPRSARLSRTAPNPIPGLPVQGSSDFLVVATKAFLLYIYLIIYIYIFYFSRGRHKGQKPSQILSNKMQCTSWTHSERIYISCSIQ